MRAAIYTRVSTEEQAKDDKLSLKDQEQRCRKWCAENGHLVVGIYTDPGVSGATFDRPGIQAALDAARRGEYDVLLSTVSDRLTRGGPDHMGYLAYVLDANGVRLEFVDENYDETPTGQMMRGMSGWRSAEERAKLRSRATVGRKGRAEKGLSNAPTAAFGYRREVEHHQQSGRAISEGIVVEEYTAAWVRKIYDLYLTEGLPLRQIAFALNEAAVPLRRAEAGRWTAGSIRRVLSNEAYTGTGWQNRVETIKKRNKQGDLKTAYRLKPRDEWLPISFPPIIDRATFDAAQERITQNKPWRRPAEGKSSRYLLQGLVRCAECGSALIVQTYGGKQRQRLGYVCNGQLKRGTDCHRPQWLKADKLEGPVWERIVEACQNPDLWLAASEAHDAMAGELETDADRLLEAVRAKRAKAQEERQNLVRAVATGTLNGTDRDVKAVIAEYDDRLAAWDNEVERLEARTGQRARQAVEREQAEALAREIGPKVGRLSFDQRRELVRAMVRLVWVDREGQVSIEAGIPYLEQRAGVGSFITIKVAKLIGVRP